jgi:hypothetical protein
MAHCPPERLVDLAATLAQIATWPDIIQKSPGVFYLKRVPFMHFHVKGDRRWADCREGTDWGEPIEAPLGLSQADFLARVQRAYEATRQPRPRA